MLGRPPKLMLRCHVLHERPALCRHMTDLYRGQTADLQGSRAEGGVAYAGPPSQAHAALHSRRQPASAIAAAAAGVQILHTRCQT